MSEPHSPEDETAHPRWSRVEADEGFFVDEDALRRSFYLILSAGCGLFCLLAAGLWRLQAAALAPPVFIGIAHGLVFSGRPEGLSAVLDGDFDQQLSDTVEVLFSRTEKGLPPEIGQFCTPGVVAAVDQAYRGSGGKYPAGYVQTLAILEAKPVEAPAGCRRTYYRGLLSSRSLAASQSSPIYLDCTFAPRGATPLNAAGWRLIRVGALSRDDFYRAERERAARRLLGLPAEAAP
jgi:hypothetical protein